eukprot:792675-Pyramimonas_sp.AAC.1
MVTRTHSSSIAFTREDRPRSFLSSPLPPRRHNVCSPFTHVCAQATVLEPRPSTGQPMWFDRAS